MTSDSFDYDGITRKAIETFDIFSIGLFLGSEYRKCTDRKKQNQN